jgi:hypothetical protein
VFILKADKVVCFDTLLQVFILNDLAREKCTKIVQELPFLETLQTKELGSFRQFPGNRNGQRGLAGQEARRNVT